MPSLALQPATVPVDTPFPPPNAQALVNFISASLSLSGLDDLKGVVVSTHEPPAADRDKLWCLRDPSSQRALGLYAYNGGWLPVPAIIPSGEDEPAGAKKGELFFNTKLNALRFFNGEAWTTNVSQSGATEKRPDPASTPIGYIFFDTDINRELRMTARGWTTVEGGVGDIKMVNLARAEDALAVNPGWVVFSEMTGRFPLGAGDSEGDFGPQAEGGVALDEMKLTWSAKGRSASGGAREATATFLSSLTLNGVEALADGKKLDAPTALLTDRKINLTPPYKALVFLRKEF